LEQWVKIHGSHGGGIKAFDEDPFAFNLALDGSERMAARAPVDVPLRESLPFLLAALCFHFPASSCHCNGVSRHVSGCETGFRRCVGGG